ncbi:MAG: hypothetical protein ABR875_03355 [Minisyncoccia bacterium]|jgi:hypothetical protein
MKEYKHLVKDIMPCWYELSWKDDKKKPAINIRVHKDFVRQTKEIPADAPVIEEYRRKFGLGEFCTDMNKGFGFEGAFLKESESDEFVVWSGKLPKIRKDETRECHYCKGSGKDIFMDDICHSCDGTGHEHKIDWHDADAFSASYSIFSMLSEYPEEMTRSSAHQLMTVETYLRQGMGGAAICGIYGIDLVKWLSSKVGNTLDEMIKAMMNAYGHMWELKPFDRHDFNSWVAYEGGWLNVHCPGNACGLNPSHSSGPDRGRGYQFSCHNVDSTLQQITLLAGLAALHDQARKEISTQP